MIAHLYHLGGVDYRETLGIAAFGLRLRRDLLPVAEENDAAVFADGVEGHHGTLHDRLGREVASHSVNTNL